MVNAQGAAPSVRLTSPKQPALKVARPQLPPLGLSPLSPDSFVKRGVGEEMEANRFLPFVRCCRRPCKAPSCPAASGAGGGSARSGVAAGPAARRGGGRLVTARLRPCSRRFAAPRAKGFALETGRSGVHGEALGLGGDLEAGTHAGPGEGRGAPRYNGTPGPASEGAS